MGRIKLVIFLILFSCAEERDDSKSAVSAIDPNRTNLSNYPADFFQFDNLDGISATKDEHLEKISRPLETALVKALQIAEAAGMFINKDSLEFSKTYIKSIVISKSDFSQLNGIVAADLKAIVSTGSKISIGGSFYELIIKAYLSDKNAYAPKNSVEVGKIYITKDLDLKVDGKISASIGDILNVLPIKNPSNIVSLIVKAASKVGGNIEGGLDFQKPGIFLIDDKIFVDTTTNKGEINRITRMFYETIAKGLCEIHDKIGQVFNKCGAEYDQAVKKYDVGNTTGAFTDSLTLYPAVGCAEFDGQMNFIFNKPSDLDISSTQNEAFFFRIENTFGNFEALKIGEFGHEIGKKNKNDNLTKILQIIDLNQLDPEMQNRCRLPLPIYKVEGRTIKAEDYKGERSCFAVPVKGNLQYSVACENYIPMSKPRLPSGLFGVPIQHLQMWMWFKMDF